MAAEQRGGDHVAAERRGASGDVQTLSARHLGELRGPMDRAGGQALDDEQAVDRRIGRDAEDHDSTASASARVGSASVPPSARVESAPQAQASASASPISAPPSHAARNPASKLSPAPVASSDSTRTAGWRAS